MPASQKTLVAPTTWALAKGPPAFSISAQRWRMKSQASCSPAGFPITLVTKPSASCDRTSGEIAKFNIETILDVTDGVMVARGDLGVEISLERVPRIQKSI